MAHLTVCIIIWTLTLLLVPLRRIRTLWRVMVISLLWMIFINNLMIGLGYYSYENIWLPIGRVPVFQLIAYPGVGILMVNWLSQKPAAKLVSILAVAMLFLLLGYFYGQAGAFRLVRIDPVTHFIYCIAALSVFMWLALAIADEQRIYSGSITRGLILSER